MLSTAYLLSAYGGSFLFYLLFPLHLHGCFLLQPLLIPSPMSDPATGRESSFLLAGETALNCFLTSLGVHFWGLYGPFINDSKCWILCRT